MRERLDHMDFFRAVAIIMIVAGHCFHLSYYTQETFNHQFLKNVMANWSACFIFISGYFSYYIDGEVINIKKHKNFVLKKLKRVGLPYLFVSLIIIYFQLDPAFHMPIEWWHPYIPTLEGLKNWLVDFNLTWIPVNQITLYLWQLSTGVHAVPFWFIPALILLVLITMPLHIIVRKHKTAIPFLICMFIVSNIVQRPVIWSSNPIHCAVYFTFFYALGIYWGYNRKLFSDSLKNLFPVFLILTIALTLLQTSLTPIVGNYAKNFFEISNMDYTAWQKIFTIFAFLTIPRIFLTNRILSIARVVAKYSFAIFFLHEITIYYAFQFHKVIFSWLNIDHGNLITYISTSLLILVVTLLATKLIKLLLKNNSRHFIGA